MPIEFVRPFYEKSAAKMIARSVVQTFKNPDNRREFEEWYRERYGKDYVWKYARYDKETQEIITYIKEDGECKIISRQYVGEPKAVKA